MYGLSQGAVGLVVGAAVGTKVGATVGGEVWTTIGCSVGGAWTTIGSTVGEVDVFQLNVGAGVSRVGADAFELNVGAGVSRVGATVLRLVGPLNIFGAEKQVRTKGEASIGIGERYGRLMYPGVGLLLSSLFRESKQSVLASTYHSSISPRNDSMWPQPTANSVGETGAVTLGFLKSHVHDTRNRTARCTPCLRSLIRFHAKIGYLVQEKK